MYHFQIFIIPIGCGCDDFLLHLKVSLLDHHSYEALKHLIGRYGPRLLQYYLTSYVDIFLLQIMNDAELTGQCTFISPHVKRFRQILL